MSALLNLSDPELLERCRQGDQRAWRALVIRYQGIVYSTALRVGLSADDAGDVFQDVWIELHRSVARVRNPGALPRWLVVATRRLSWKVATRRRRMVAEIPADLVDPDALADEAIEKVERHRRMDQALRSLGQPCECLLRGLYWESPHLSYDEITRRTGLAMGSIGPTKSRCLEKLRRKLRRMQ